MKKLSGYSLQHFDGETWRRVTQPQPNKRTVFKLMDSLEGEYRVINLYTGKPATRPADV